MSTNIGNKSPYLRTSREFPEDAHDLAVELSKAYLDISNNVNSRTIGNYATVPMITGNTWNTVGGNNKRQSLRQVYTFTSAGSINHNIRVADIGGFVNIYGTFTDGTIWYPLPYVNVVNATDQISLTVSATQIVITAGGGSPPSITSGFVVLEWLSQI
jgi:hypothetical protein